MWTSLARVVAPVNPAVSLEEAKLHLRVDGSVEDGLITDLIAAATGFIDGPKGIGIAMITQSWRLSLDRWPCDPISLLLTPVTEIVSVTYVDGAGDVQTIDPAGYIADLDHQPPRLRPAPGCSWPSARHQPGAIKIVFKAGYGATAEAVPSDLRAALKLILGNLYANRETLPTLGAIGCILDRYRAGIIA